MFNLYIIYAIILFNVYLKHNVNNIKLIHIKKINNLEESFLIIKIEARIKIIKDVDAFNVFTNKLNLDI
jgi:hypothetical protein